MTACEMKERPVRRRLCSATVPASTPSAFLDSTCVINSEILVMKISNTVFWGKSSNDGCGGVNNKPEEEKNLMSLRLGIIITRKLGFSVP